MRFWDINTETPHHTCKAHKHWVLSIAWAPNGKKLASGCKKSQVSKCFSFLYFLQMVIVSSSMLLGSCWMPNFYLDMHMGSNIRETTRKNVKWSQTVDYVVVLETSSLVSVLFM